MNHSSTSLCDDSFGPLVDDSCRDGFDFTLTFEQSILVLLPAAILLFVSPLRLLQLRKKPVQVFAHRMRLIKLVS